MAQLADLKNVDIKDIRLFLLDMDGTIYHENTLIPGAIEFFEKITSQGKHYAFMTNNSSKGKKAYVNKLTALGIKADERQIVSSVNVTVDYLKANYPSDVKIYLVGTDSLRQEIQENGYMVVDSDYRGHDVKLCILGFDTELTYPKIEGLCYYVSRGVDYIATNCDLRCPVKEGRFIPDCGSMAKMIEISTGRAPRFLGKPEPEIVNSASNEFDVPVDKILCVGDRLYTDIAVGIKSGAASALVLTGETQQSDLKDTEFFPTFIFPSIKELSEAL